MHELSLAMSVAEIIETEMRRRPGSRLKSVEIEVGDLSGVEPVTFETAMNSVLASSGYAGAVCRLIHVAGRASCLDCGEDFAATGRWPSCPRCSSARCIVTGGTEFRVVSFTVDE